MHIKKILIVNPAAPPSFWGFDGVNSYLGIRYAHGSLALVTLAAMVPAGIQVHLLDERARMLAQPDLDWADAVFVTGMNISREAIGRIVKAARAASKPAVVGGPFVSSEPDAPEFEGASVFVGEAIDWPTWRAMLADLEAGKLLPRYVAAKNPPIAQSPVPRFDLWNFADFADAMLQTTIGCPFRCDFCGVWKLHGRPRTKSPEQITAELSALYRAGYRGKVFIADDNFNGDCAAAKRTAETMLAWQKRHGFPFAFYTQADLRLAKEQDLARLMVEAGFDTVFVGIESPSTAALEQMGKKQNIGIDVENAVADLRAIGLRVQAGFIIGNDGETPAAFDAMRRFVDLLAIPRAMVGLRVALKGTDLHAKMEAQGRLMPMDESDQMASTNIRPDAMSPAELIARHRALIAELYHPSAFFRRAERELDDWRKKLALPARWRDLRAALLSALRQGLFSDYRVEYWRFLARVFRKNPSKIGSAIAEAVVFSHFHGYARRLEAMLGPTLEAALRA
jgi:radical SAM superfamily enzyme YgiQ (UPF0313 family)